MLLTSIEVQSRFNRFGIISVESVDTKESCGSHNQFGNGGFHLLLLIFILSSPVSIRCPTAACAHDPLASVYPVTILSSLAT